MLIKQLTSMFCVGGIGLIIFLFILFWAWRDIKTSHSGFKTYEYMFYDNGLSLVGGVWNDKPEYTPGMRRNIVTVNEDGARQIMRDAKEGKIKIIKEYYTGDEYH